VFCQNYQISQNRPTGRAVGTDEFAGICLALEGQGAENINIVTGSHAIPAIAAGLDVARAGGLKIPALWNTSSYENAQALELLRGRIKMFLPDLKTLDTGLASRFFRAPDYPVAAAAAIMKMLEMSEDAGAAPDGVIIRHLILPGFLESTRQVLRWFADNAQGRASLSLMTQYTPVKNASPSTGDDAGPAVIPSRYVNKTEYETVLAWCEEFGIEDGYCQELVTNSAWLPDFKRPNPFTSRLSKPVWHWRDGFAR
jgi:putative pyruvate formate lyase activating enzyme